IHVVRNTDVGVDLETLAVLEGDRVIDVALTRPHIVLGEGRVEEQLLLPTDEVTTNRSCHAVDALLATQQVNVDTHVTSRNLLPRSQCPATEDQCRDHEQDADETNDTITTLLIHHVEITPCFEVPRSSWRGRRHRRSSG